MELEQIIEKLEQYEFILDVTAPDVYTDELQECIEALKKIAKEAE